MAWRSVPITSCAEPERAARRCPLCSQPGAAEVQRQVDFGIQAEGERRGFDIVTVMCRTCSLVYTDPQPDPELLSHFYAGQARDLFVADGCEARTPGAGARRDQVAWLEASGAPIRGARVLEVGCYDGYLLSLLRDRGADPVGVEPCQAAAAFARQQFSLDVRANRFEDESLSEVGPFQLVALSHVLEHLSDPREALRRCRELIADDGFLFIEVPNVLQPRVSSVVDFFTFDHLFNFSPATLTSLAAQCGFERVTVEEDFPFPAFRFLARAAEARPGALPCKAEVAQSQEAVRAYVSGRARFTERLRARIEDQLARWVGTGARIALYGAGYHTEYLFAQTGIGRANIVAVVDGNPEKHGSRIFGRPVLPADALAQLSPDVVIISSYDFQDEMSANAQRCCPSSTEVVTFYEATPAFSSYQGKPAPGARRIDP